MAEKINREHDKMFRIIDNDGNIIHDQQLKHSKDDLKTLFKLMLTTRKAEAYGFEGVLVDGNDVLAIARIIPR